MAVAPPATEAVSAAGTLPAAVTGKEPWPTIKLILASSTVRGCPACGLLKVSTMHTYLRKVDEDSPKQL
jgi:hypothetical protein